MQSPTAPGSPDDAIPAGLAQERFWFVDELLPGSPVHNLAFAIDIDGDLDVEAVRGALATIAQRHDILRTRFAVRDGRLCFGAVDRAGPELVVTDVPAADLDAATRALASTPFSYTAGPMLRAALLRPLPPDAATPDPTGPDATRPDSTRPDASGPEPGRSDARPNRHRLVLVAHHAIFDGWSFGVFATEFGTAYRALAAGVDAGLPPPAGRYADFAAAQRERLASGGFAADLAYWSATLAGLADTEPVTLPLDFPRPDRLRFRGGTHRFRVAAAERARLRAVAAEESTTEFVAYLAALQVLLGRRTGRTDIVVGAPVAGRTDTTSQLLIGPFLNVVMLRGDLSGDPTFRELLVRDRAVNAGAFAHADVPLQCVVERLATGRAPATAPFRVALALQNSPTAALDLGTGLRLRDVPVDPDTAQNDLSLFLTPTPDGMDAMLVYDRDVFRPETAAGFATDLLDVIRRAGHTADSPASRLLRRPVPAASLDALTGQPTPGPDATLVARFGRWAAGQPDRDALVHQGRRVTYGELDSWSNRIAHTLLAHGARAGEPVALVMDPHPLAIATLLGVLKAGAAFACLDPRQPPARHARILSDLAPALVVVDTADHPPGPAPILVLDDDAGTEQPDTPPRQRIGPESPAYLAYTSGSTGRPKGIPHRHVNLVQFVDWQSEAFDIRPGLRVAQLASLAFDVSYCEIFGALCHGATLCLRPPGVGADPVRLATWLRTDEVHLLQVIPRLFEEILAAARPEGLPALRTVLFVGEALHAERVNRARALLTGNVRLVNVYGPTEVVAATYHEVPTSDQTPGTVVPIGRPIPGRHLVLLDDAGAPCRPGQVGEICVLSPYLTDGYHRDEEQTALRFVPSPLPDRPGVLYRTGDLARLRTDAPLLEFVGRRDNQVKISGIRVELEEVEAAVTGHPRVRECAAALRPAGTGQRLVAYVVTSDGAPPAGLPEQLRRTVPAHLVPAEVIVLDALPRTATGKIDRAALPAPAATAPPATGYVAPRTFLERTLAALVAEVLGVERVGAHDNFFDIGGNSLQAARLVNRVRDELGLDIGLQTLLDAPTVAGAAAAAQAGGGQVDYDTELALIERELELLPAEQLAALARHHQHPTENPESHDQHSRDERQDR